MRPLLPPALALLLAAAPHVLAQDAAQATATHPAPPAIVAVVEPKALDLLRAMSATLAAARTLRFTAVASWESPSLPGPALVYFTKSEVTLQRPDKLRIVSPGDGPPFEFYYDGKTMMAYAPAEDLLAVADAPPTIDATLKAAFDAASIYFPFTDVLVADPYADMAQGLQWAFVVGRSQLVGGVPTDIVAIANDDVFVQLWIGVKDHLPRLGRAVFRRDPSRLRQEVAFADWRRGEAVPGDSFTTAKAASAKRIAFARPDVRLPDGAPAPKPTSPR
ncbi:MAG: DUF2092 domain-containing protein [bacterium]|nr:DUF2092 domain-containing protein [bacterium]